MKPRTFQAIVTKFLPCTNTRPARIKATAAAGSVTIGADTDKAQGYEDAHHVAAKALAEKFGWRGHWYAGGLPDGSGNAYVCADTVDGSPIATFTL